MREMKDSGVEWIGKIPKDWEIVPLTKQLDSIVDYRGKTPEKTEEGTFLVTAKNIKDGKICYELSKEYVREADYEEIMHRGIPQIGDILFTTEAPLGQVANVDRTDIALAQRIIKFRAYESIRDMLLNHLHERRYNKQLTYSNYYVMNKLRVMFARISVSMLEPDLVIMDEFQRFKFLLSSDDSELGILAHSFLSGHDTRVLLLSATPYKLYSTLEEIDEPVCIALSFKDTF